MNETVKRLRNDKFGVVDKFYAIHGGHNRYRRQKSKK